MVVDPNSAVGKAIKNGEYVAPEDGAVVVWWKSKKFVAYMVGDFTWKILMGAMLFVIANYHDGVISGGWLTLLFAVIVTAGVAEMGFLGGQAWIDRYTTAIKIPAELGKRVLTGGVEAASGREDTLDNLPPVPDPPASLEDPEGLLAEDEITP